MQKIFFSLFIFLAPFFNNVNGMPPADTPPIEHTIWDALLKKHVSPDGTVNYKGFIGDKVRLEEYLSLLSKTPPNKKTWSRAEQLAYWINAYNAFTVKLIADHYPVKSIKDIKKGIPFINSVWDMDFFHIGGKEMTLNDIEHNIIRPQFKEPRIHFAVNCASYSCPQLRNEAYTVDRLDVQLTEQTRQFLADSRRNSITNGKNIQLSSIFKWYSTDFTKQGLFSWIFGGSGRDKNLIQFIAPYVEVELSSDAEIEFVPYNWSLNDKN